MLSLNSDILSEKGIVQSIWDEYVSNTCGTNSKVAKDVTDRSFMSYFSDNPMMNVIIDNTRNNIINHLYLEDDSCMSTIKTLSIFSNTLKRLNVSNSYSEFIYKLSESLNDYILINDKNSNNSNINWNDNVYSSFDDETKIIYAMLKNGLIDSNEVQSLLDNQNLELVTTANSLIARCSRGESPSNRSCGIPKASLLKLGDFGTDESRIIECAKSFINEGVDLIPNSPSEINKMLFTGDDFDSQVLYSQDNYISNLANYGIVSSTAKRIEDSFNADDETGMYILSSLLKQLESFIDKFDKTVCLVMYMATVMVLIKKINKLDVDELDKINLINSMKKELVNSFSMYEEVHGTEKPLSNMVRIPKELKDFISVGFNTNRIICNDGDDNLSNLDTALNDILSSIEEIKETMEFYGINSTSDTGNVVSLESADVNSLAVESIGSKIRDTNKETYVSLVEGHAKKFHSELNQSLLEGDFENAAKEIAREVALLEQVNDNQFDGSSILETIERDITTYKEMVNASSSGISNYMSMAKSEVYDLMYQQP